MFFGSIETDSPQAFIGSWLASQVDRGRGLKVKMAERLGISPSHFSQLLKGERSISPEQAIELSEFMGISELETEMFMLLVDLERAGSAKLKKRISAAIEKKRHAARQISNRIRTEQKLSGEVQAQYYSSWIYPAIRNLVAIDGFNSLQAISDALKIESVVVGRALEFLIEHGLCVIDEKGRVGYGSSWIHLSSNSPMANVSHQNWRLQAMNKMNLNRVSDLYFTSPMSLSREAVEAIRAQLLSTVENVKSVAQPSQSETLFCLNIDWFQV